MLFPELVNDGRPSVGMNAVQQEACRNYNNKVKAAKYTFHEISCRICNKNDFDEIGGKDRYGLTYLTVICNHCGLIQSASAPDEKTAFEFYNHEYPLIYFGSHAPYKKSFSNQYERANLIFRFIMPYLPNSKGFSELNVFEAGCNAGGILKYFADRGFRVSGIEMNEDAVKFATGFAGIDVKQGTLASVQPQPAPDVIIYSHLLEHLENPLKELELIRETMNADSLLYIEVPGIKNIHLTYNGRLILYLQNAHITHFSLSTLRNLLQLAGFEIISANEGISCLCRKSENKNSDLQSDREEVMAYLQNIQILSKTFHYKISRLNRLPKEYVKKMMKLTGLYPAFFKWYHMQK